MKKHIFKLTIILLGLLINTANAEIIDFTKKSNNINENVISVDIREGLNEGKKEFGLNTKCIEMAPQNISGKISGIVNKNNNNIYLVKTKSGLQHFSSNKNYEINEEVKNIKPDFFCK